MRYEKYVNHCTIARLVLEICLICVCEKEQNNLWPACLIPFLHMGRLLRCFLTHENFLTPGKAKLKSKFLKAFILHTGFTLWNTSFIETNSRVKPRTIFGRQPRFDLQITCKTASWGEGSPMLSGWQRKHMKVERKSHHLMWLSHWSSWRKTLSRQSSWLCSTPCKVVRI